MFFEAFRITKFLFPLISLLAISETVFCQTKKLDSLKQELIGENDPTRLARIYNQMAYDSYYYNPDTTKKWAAKALIIAEEIDNKKEVALANRYLGLAEENTGNLESSISYFQKTKSYASLENDSVLLAKSLINIGNIYRKQGQYNRSLDLYNQSRQISEQLSDTAAISGVQINIAIVYKLLGNHPESLSRYLSALQIKENQRDSVGIAIALQGIGLLYLNMEEYEKSIQHLNKSLEIKLRMGNNLGIAITSNNLGVAYIKAEKYEQALEPLYLSIKLRKKMGQNCGIAYPMQNLGEAFLHMGKLDSAEYYLRKIIKSAKECTVYPAYVRGYINLSKIYSQKYQLPEAEKALLRAYQLSLKSSVQNQLKVSSELSDFYSQNKDYENAFKFNVIHNNVKDSVFNEESVKKFTRLEAEYEFEKEKQVLASDREKRELELENEIHFKQQLGMSVSLGLFILLTVLYYYYKSKLKSNRLLQVKNNVISTQNIQIAESAKKEKLLLEQQLQLKDRELASIAMQINERNNTLLKLEDKLDEIEGNFGDKKEFKKFKNLLKSNRDEKDAWNNFISKFDAVYPNFFEKLKYDFDGLTLNQLKICAYIKVGMDNKDIADVTHTAIGSAKMNINRIKKKLELGPEENIRDFMIKFN